MKRFFLFSALALSLFAQAMGGFVVNATASDDGLRRGILVSFSSDDPAAVMFVVETHCMLNGVPTESHAYAMTQYGGTGFTFIPLGNYSASIGGITAQAWEITGIGRSAQSGIN